MPQNEGNHGICVCAPKTAADDQNPARLPPVGIEPELTVLTSENLPVSGHSAGFVAQIWHRPYAEALIEANPVRLRALIVEAERAILIRVLQPSASSVGWDESLDIQHAADALSQLKKAIVEDSSRRKD
jgi:hypothetical protein